MEVVCTRSVQAIHYCHTTRICLLEFTTCYNCNLVPRNYGSSDDERQLKLESLLPPQFNTATGEVDKANSYRQNTCLYN